MVSRIHSQEFGQRSFEFVTKHHDYQHDHYHMIYHQHVVL